MSFSLSGEFYCFSICCAVLLGEALRWAVAWPVALCSSHLFGSAFLCRCSSWNNSCHLKGTSLDLLPWAVYWIYWIYCPFVFWFDQSLNSRTIHVLHSSILFTNITQVQPLLQTAAIITLFCSGCSLEVWDIPWILRDLVSFGITLRQRQAQEKKNTQALQCFEIHHIHILLDHISTKERY